MLARLPHSVWEERERDDETLDIEKLKALSRPISSKPATVSDEGDDGFESWNQHRPKGRLVSLGLT